MYLLLYLCLSCVDFERVILSEAKNPSTVQFVCAASSFSASHLSAFASRRGHIFPDRSRVSVFHR